MAISKKLKEQVIIIADNNEILADEIKNCLNDYGFSNIQKAKNGDQVYEILRPHFNEPEKIGLLIINENLPKCQVSEMCLSLSSNDNEHPIPFLILGSIKNNIDLVNDSFNRCISLPINYSEFLIVIEFQLMIKHEKFLRHQQEECLINELAERKVIDAKLKYLVVHDELTSLFNRQNF